MYILSWVVMQGTTWHVKEKFILLRCKRMLMIMCFWSLCSEWIRRAIGCSLANSTFWVFRGWSLSFPGFCEVLKSWKHYILFVWMQHDRHWTNTVVQQERIDAKIQGKQQSTNVHDSGSGNTTNSCDAGVKRRFVLSLILGNINILGCSCHFVDYRWFEKAITDTVRWVMHSWKPKEIAAARKAAAQRRLSNFWKYMQGRHLLPNGGEATGFFTQHLRGS